MEQTGIRLVADVSDFNKGLQAYENGLKKMDTATDNFITKASKGWQTFGSNLADVGHNVADVGNILADKLTKPMVGLVNTAVDSAGEFQDQMALIQVATKDAGYDMERIGEFALKMGADSVFGATESAEAMLGLLKAGQQADEVMGTVSEEAGGMGAALALASKEGITLTEAINELGGTTGTLEAVLNLATASGMSMAESSDLLSIAMATFGREAEDATDIVNNFVQAADASVMEVSDIGQALTNIGPTAAAFGFSLEDVNTALALLSQRGIQGGEAGTALKSMLTNIMRPTDSVTEALSDLNIQLYDSQGNMKELPELVDSFSKALGDNATIIEYHGALTKSEQSELDRLQKIYQRTQQSLSDYTSGIKGANLDEEARNEKLSELRQVLVNTSKAMDPLIAKQKTGTEVVRELTQEQKNQYIQTLAGTYGMKAMQSLLDDGIEGWEGMEDAIAGAAVAGDVMNAKMGTWNGVVEALSGSVDTMKIKLGNSITKAFTPLLGAVSRLVDRFSSLDFSKFTSKFIDPLVNGLIKVIEWVTQLDEDTLYWAAALAAAGAAIGPILIALGGFITVLGTAVGALGVLISPLGLLAAAIAGIGVVASNNISSISGFFGVLKTLGKYLLAVVQDGDVYNDWITDLPEGMQIAAQKIGRALSNITSFVENSVSNIRSALSFFMSGNIEFFDWSKVLPSSMVGTAEKFADGLNTLRRVAMDMYSGVFSREYPWGELLPEGLAKKAEELTNVVYDLIDGFGQLGKGNWEGAISSFTEIDWGSIAEMASGSLTWLFGQIANIGSELLATLTNALFDLLGKIDWATLGNWLGEKVIVLWQFAFGIGSDVLSYVWSAITNLFKNIDWKKVGDTVASATSALWDSVMSISGNVLSTITTALTNLFNSIDWGKVGSTVASAASTLWNGVFNISKDVAGLIWDALTSMLGGIDWGKLGGDVASAASGMWDNALRVTGDTISNVKDTISAKLSDINWGGIGNSVKGRTEELWANMLSGIEEFTGVDLSGFIDTLGNAAKTVGDMFAPSVERLGKGIKGFAEALQPAIPALKSLWDNIANNVLPALGALAALVTGVLVVAFKVFVDYISAVLPSIGANIAGVVQIISGLLTSLTGFISGIINVLVALFTGGDWKGAMIDSMNSVVEGIQNIWDGLKTVVISTIQGTIDGIIAIFTGLWEVLVGNSIVPDIVNGIIDSFASMGEALFSMLEGVGQFMVNAWTNIRDSATEAINGLAVSVSENTEGIRTRISEVMDSISNKFTEGWNAVLNTTASLLGLTREDIDTKLNAAKKVVDDVLGLVSEAFKGNWDTVFKTTGTWLNNMNSAITDKLNQIYQWLIELLQRMLENFRTQWENILLTTTTWLENMYTFIMEKFQAILEWVLNWLSNLYDSFVTYWNDIVNAVIEAMGNIASAISEKASAVVDAFNEIWDKVREGISNATDTVIDAVSGLIDDIANSFSNFSDRFTEIGSDIVDGIWQGLRDSWGSLRDGVQNLIGNFVDWIKRLLGIASPSEVMLELFGYVVEGMAKPLENADILLNAAQNLRDRLEDTLVNDWKEINVGLKGSISGAVGVSSTPTYNPPSMSGGGDIRHIEQSTHNNWQVNANYANDQSEASIIEDLQAMNLLYRMGAA